MGFRLNRVFRRRHPAAAAPAAVDSYVPERPVTLIDKVARFVACESIEGDYLEFGVYRGAAFVEAYQAMERQFRSRIGLAIGGDDDADRRQHRQNIWQQMRFFAFDSFEGLPSLTSDDADTHDFRQGQYACAEGDFRRIVTQAGVPEARLCTVPGWFDQTCNTQTRERFRLQKAAVVWIDADLYSSTITALNFVTDLLQDGTVLIFDDWFSYRGSPLHGEQRAFREWSAALTDRFSFQEYQREGWKRMSFICSATAS